MEDKSAKNDADCYVVRLVLPFIKDANFVVTIILLPSSHIGHMHNRYLLPFWFLKNVHVICR